MSSDIETEICIIGAGPAGAALATRLAQFGRDVCLVERQAVPRPHIGESLPASVWPILNLLGVAPEVEAAGFLCATGSVLHWGGQFERRGPTAGQPGLLVDRGQFDSILLDAAQREGAQVLTQTRAYRPDHSADGWCIPLRSEQGPRQLRANVLIDAAGRQAGFGRRYRQCAPPLLALYAYWQAPPGFGAQARVEAGEAHWVWAALLPNGLVNAMVFVDPARCTGLTPADRRDLYLNLLAQSPLLSPCLEQRRMGPVRQADATSQIEMTPPTADFLRVGEASFCVDPLSSQGVQLAMGQALQAAAVVNTVLTRPDHAAQALDFYADRQQERVQVHAQLAAEYYARQLQISSDPFWQNRSQAPEWLQTGAIELETAPVPTQAKLILSTKAHLHEAGVQTETLIEPGQVLSHPNLPRPVANLDGIALPPLIASCQNPTGADDLRGRFRKTLPPDLAERVVHWLWTYRILVVAD
ncbi:NAD(P)/FAD-dependent oxidoreductase [Ruegeria sp. HKCCD7255]|uniref:flavin-dependent monooxygenase QhpG n=1 Tax=Ruegeria sp. HKCCD7255 TaxID=2683004 RepID=UPI0014899A6F|nr:tryptophan 7-halogenase [Ruegeria sp. HKCCD7255]